MFVIHQRTRRRLCQAGFCLLCGLPTTGLLTWAATLRTASHRESQQREIGERLGLTLRFRRVRYPRPGQSRFDELELADAETGAWLLRCRTLDVVRTGKNIALDPHDVRVAAEHADKLLRLAVRRLTRELPGDEAVALVPTQVTLESAAGSQTYDDVSGRIEPAAEESMAVLRFRLPEVEAGEPPRLTVVRHPTANGVSTKIKLETLGATLPISAFGPWFDLGPLLGDDASFNGSLTVEQRGGRFACEASGTFAGVDLERLVARRFPHHVTGRATLEIKQARLRADKLSAAEGVLRSDSGTIGGRLLNAAVELLGCQPGPAPLGQLPFAAAGNLAYRGLNVVFSVGERGITLKGKSETAPLILNERGEALLFAADDAPLPLIQLVRALVPHSEAQVPATKETAQLVRWLPLPPIQPAANAEPDAPPLRLNDRETISGSLK